MIRRHGHLGKVAPACHNGSASIDAREIGELVQLGDRGIDAVAYRYESCCDEAAAAFGAGEKVLQHHVTGAASFLAHVDIAIGAMTMRFLTVSLLILMGEKSLSKG